MSRVYDNWERLVAAVLIREKLRQLALFDSFDSSISADFSSRFSFGSSHEDVSASRISSEAISLEVPPCPSNLEFEEIKKATKNFRYDFTFEYGTWGTVFKGWIDEHTLTASMPGIGIAIGVKIWNAEGLQAHEECLKELSYLSQLHHPNVVKLIAYCSKEEKIFSVYEFMPKGSLDKYLFRSGCETQSGFGYQSLSWATRIKVAIGAARGLSFLHANEKPVMYGMFKTGDILLDGGEFNAKLCNFSLARDGPSGDMTYVSTRVLGSYGYAAPEYIATGALTTKCDVYGFGVVLLELLSGRRFIDSNRPSKQQNLAVWAKPYLLDKRKVSRVMDPKLEGQYSRKESCTVAAIALQCLSANPKRRPPMAEVLAALQRFQGSKTM